jgi:hypothetical protein
MESDGGPAWSARAADLIHWFHLRRGEMGDTPFALNAWTFVSMPTGFYAALARDIACGPTSTRAAALVGDLEDFFTLWAR